MGVFGLALALLLGNFVPVCAELTSPDQAVLLFMTELLSDGAGGLVASFLCCK